MTLSRYAPRRVMRALRYRLCSQTQRLVVLRRDLRAPLRVPPAKVPITVRPARPADRPRILELLTQLAGYERTARELFLAIGIGTCYLAITGQGEICYMQWLLGQQDNGLLASHTDLPILGDGEALVENAFTPAAFRGQGIMACAMAQIAALGAGLGARWVLTVVGEDNAPSIKGCRKAGFEPYLLKLDRWRAFRHRIDYLPIPPGYVVPVLEHPAPVAVAVAAEIRQSGS